MRLSSSDRIFLRTHFIDNNMEIQDEVFKSVKYPGRPIKMSIILNRGNLTIFEQIHYSNFKNFIDNEIAAIFGIKQSFEYIIHTGGYLNSPPNKTRDINNLYRTYSGNIVKVEEFEDTITQREWICPCGIGNKTERYYINGNLHSDFVTCPVCRIKDYKEDPSRMRVSRYYRFVINCLSEDTGVFQVACISAIPLGNLTVGTRVVFGGVYRIYNSIVGQIQESEFRLAIHTITSTNELQKSPSPLTPIVRYGVSELIKKFVPGIGQMDYMKLLTFLLAVSRSNNDILPFMFRADMNFLIVGDPGVGKSYYLQAVEDSLNFTKFHSIESSTSAGLRASVTKTDSGNYQLEQGAISLSNGGIFMLDELDKGDLETLLPLKEPMDTRRITYAKAGILTSFEASAPILASANPKSGKFQGTEEYESQLNLPRELLASFDIIYCISEGDLREGEVGILSNEDERVSPVPDNLNFTSLLNRMNRHRVGFDTGYISALEAFIYNEYGNYPYGNTTRDFISLLYSIIRISVSFAKLRLSDKLTQVDFLDAIAVMSRSLYVNTVGDVFPVETSEEMPESNEEIILSTIKLYHIRDGIKPTVDEVLFDTGFSKDIFDETLTILVAQGKVEMSLSADVFRLGIIEN